MKSMQPPGMAVSMPCVLAEDKVRGLQEVIATSLVVLTDDGDGR